MKLECLELRQSISKLSGSEREVSLQSFAIPPESTQIGLDIPSSIAVYSYLPL
jgi:hypothetical protein